YYLHNTNFGDTRKETIGQPYNNGFLSIQDQIKYKYIVSIEGYDVATNLKWIMNSNSLCFMNKPKYETWFMEGTLIPNHHYV
ncbi:glycosyl transferase family 90, partial [Francisella tularensis subsp. holarctica]|uniref:glycosyl transferase family 90 n=1 Tax=Francisella tularensis TaxID=263 RepID=UPI002381AD19